VSPKSQAQPPKLLLLVPRSMNSIEVEEVSKGVKSKLTSSLGLTDAGLTDSAAWYREMFESCGNWDSWIWETVTGRDYETREPHFDGFVVCGDRLGRASASIVNLALRNGRAVLAWEESLPLRSVQEVVPIDREDMTYGWGLGATTDIKGDVSHE